MRKLLSSNFSRLWKSKIFWFCMAIMFIYAVGYMLNGCRMANRAMSEPYYSADGAASQALAESYYSLDDFYFQFALSIGGACAIFCSLFHGTEYSDGTLRNKIVVGHTRVRIYLANLLLTFTATLLFVLAWVVGAMVAIPTLGLWKMSPPGLFVCLLIIVLFIAAFSAIFTAVAMLCPNKASSVTASMLLFFGLLVIAANLDNRLSEPEMSSHIVITANGMEMGEPTPNPDYLTGTKREIYQFFYDFLPTGQGVQMAFLKMEHPVRMMLSSVFLTVTVTLGGIGAFRKKNLN